jgi:hypothetical protein
MTPLPEPVGDRQTASSFTMHGAREVIDEGAPYIVRQVDRLEQAVRNNDVGLTFDFAKSLMETTCITILDDRGIPYSKTDSFPHLVNLTVVHLPIVPKSHENIPEIKESLKTFIGGINAVMKGLSEIRNKEGLASHGKDAYALQLDNVQAHLVARSVDALVNFLFKIHRGYPGGHAARGIRYDDHPELNEYIDSSNEVISIFEYRYRASEVLYNTDLEAYCTLLSEMGEKTDSVDIDLFKELPLTGEQ